MYGAKLLLTVLAIGSVAPVCSAVTVPEGGPGGEHQAALRKLVIARVSAGERPVMYLELLGKPARAQVLAAAEQGLTVAALETKLPVSWREIPPTALGALAAEVAKTGPEFVAVARFCAAHKLTAQAEKAATAALDIDKGLAEEIGAALALLPKEESPQPRSLAGPVAKEGAAPPSTATPGEPARTPSSGSRVNHAGRALPPLPPLPEIKAPVMFGTPEADAILSAMQVFPKDHPFNEDISKLPVHPDSDKIIANTGAEKSVSVSLSLPFIIVPPNQPKVEVKFEGGAVPPRSFDKGPFPVPDNTPIQDWQKRWSKEYNMPLEQLQRQVSGADRHTFIVDPFNQRLYEFYHMRKTDAGWQAGVAAVWDLTSNKARPDGMTSANVAGLPFFAGMAQRHELERGMVEHAMGVSVPRTRRAFIWPASHHGSGRGGAGDDPGFPACGQRLRLKASVPIDDLPKEAKAIALGLKKYGMIVNDNSGGNAWDINVTSDPRHTTVLQTLYRLKGRDFEVVVTTGENEGPRARRP
jgi:hypothetical protein